MIYKITALVLILGFANSISANDSPLLTYHWNGGYSPYKEIYVTILQSGEAKVTGQKHGLSPINYQTQLIPEELETLKVLIKSTEFFSQPEQDPLCVEDAGKKELTIQLDNQKKSLKYRYRPSMIPLNSFIWKLITQATAIEAIKHDGEIYIAAGTVRPTCAGMKTLQPSSLKPYFMSYLRKHNKRQNIEWVLEALAWITTPEEFCGFISLGLEDENQRKQLLSIIGTPLFYGSIPESHLKSLCPIYLTFARNAYLRKDQLGKTEKQALSDFATLLGITKYKPSIPMFTAWFETHKKPYITTPLCPLANMGKVSLNALIPYLESKEDFYRINAIELLTIASRNGPNCGFAYPLSGTEYSKMIPIFTNNVIPKLLVLSKDDPSVKVRKKATEAAKEIEQWIKKEKNSTK